MMGILQSVNSALHPCCTLHEWLILPLRGSTEFCAGTALSLLRARAAGKPNSQSGLFAAIRSVAACSLDEPHARARTAQSGHLIGLTDAALQRVKGDIRCGAKIG